MGIGGSCTAFHSIQSVDAHTVWWVSGVCSALVSNALSSSGLVMQRSAHLKKLECTSNGDLAGASRSSRFYIAGVAVYIIAAPFDVLSYGLAPQVVCSTIGCFRIVLVTALAWIALNEPVGLRSIAGVGICTWGTFLCLWSSPEELAGEPPTSSVQGLYHKRSGPYLVLGVGLLILLLVCDHTMAYWGHCIQRSQSLQGFVLSFATAWAFAVEKVINNELGFVKMPDEFSMTFIWFGLAATSMWFLLVASLALFGLLNLYLNLRGMKLLPVKVFVPLTVGFGNALRLFQSVWILEEFHSATRSDMALSLFGAFLALLGALLIQTENDPENRPEEREDHTGDVELAQLHIDV